MRITINDDADFLMTNDRGDVPVGAELGLYHEDTRFLSDYRLRVDDQELTLLAARSTQYNAGVYFLTNPKLAGAQRGTLGIIRRQTLGVGLHEEILITNHGQTAAHCTLQLACDADFAHMFDVKYAVEVSQAALQRKGIYTRKLSADRQRVVLQCERASGVRDLTILFSQPADQSDSPYQFTVRLAPQAQWRLAVNFFPRNAHERTQVGLDEWERHLEERQAQRDQQTAAFLTSAPDLVTDSQLLRRGYDQSVRDYAALRLDLNRGAPDEFAIAAGVPWFMTLFGRDSLIAAYQALPFFPMLAKGVLRALARLQGTKVDALRMEEPGKILHEMRNPTFTWAKSNVPLFPYYGTIDATPLFIMVLAATYRVTGDLAFVQALSSNLVRALDWMDHYGDRDGDGYLEYLREADQGLSNQGWKDSGDAIRFRDGRFAQAPIALCEVQGYAYAARMGAAELFDALGQPVVAATQRATAATLKAQFARDFWLPERDYVALALDRDKRRVDALTSNPGQLLWTGILSPDQARLVATRLMQPDLFAGWGLRTMATSEAAYNPLSYHNGSVWPHDNSLIIAGLARYGFTREAALVAAGLIDALAYYPDPRLPELFAGYDRADSGFPVEYPTACSPQAWASGAIFLLVASALGCDPSVPSLTGTPFLPDGITTLRAEGLWFKGQRMALEAERTPAGVLTRLTHPTPVQYVTPRRQHPL